MTDPRHVDPAPVVVASTDDVKLIVHDHGGDGPPIVLCHATGLHGRAWDPIAARLADRYRCLAVDLRGHGDSSLPDGVGLAWSGMADDVLAVIEHFELVRPHGVGHSMGGCSIILAESRRPGTFARGWLFEPIVVPPELAPGRERRSLMSETARRRREVFGSRDDAYRRYASRPPFRDVDPEALRAYVDHGFEDLDDGSVRLKCRAEVEAQVFEHSITEAYDLLPGVTTPLTIAGSGDGLSPAQWAPLIADRLPHGIHEPHPDLTHFAPLEHPARMAAAIRAALA